MASFLVGAANVNTEESTRKVRLLMQDALGAISSAGFIVSWPERECI